VQRAVVEAALQAGANPFDPAAGKAIAQAVRGEYRKRGCYRSTIKALCRQRLHSPKPLVPLPVRRPRSSTKAVRVGHIGDPQAGPCARVFRGRPQYSPPT
jgi:hypothetical protein